MIRLVIETPLAKDHISPRVLATLNHICEVVLLHLIESLVILSRLDLKSMLGLWFGWLEWAGENKYFSIIDLLDHLRVREILIDNNTSDECGILQGPAGLSNHLNVIEVNVSALEVGHGEHRLHCDISHVVLALAHNLGAQSSDSALAEEFVVVLLDVDLFLDLIDAFNSDVAGLLEAISDLEGVNTLVQEFLGLIQESTGKHNNTCGAITDLIILRLR